MGRQRGFTENDYRHLADQGYSMSEAAYLMGVKKQTVSAMAKKYVIAFNDGNKRRMYRGVSMVAETAERGSYIPIPEGAQHGPDGGSDTDGGGGAV